MLCLKACPTPRRPRLRPPTCALCTLCPGTRPVSPYQSLCGLCVRHLAALRLPPTSTGLDEPVALYAYEGLVRKLVIRAKVQDDHRALDLLQALFRRSDRTRRLAAWSDAVVACPSSLWGRLRGRLDIAAHLAWQAAHAGRRPLVTAPAHLFWRPKKRARQDEDARRASAGWRPAARWSRASWERRLHRAAPEATRVLLVDDVVTTGATLREVRAAITDSERLVRFLVFAHARPPR